MRTAHIVAHWIPCTERMPEEGVRVMVYPGWGSGEVEIDEHIEKLGWLSGVEDGWRPTHWMPLPCLPLQPVEAA